MMIFFHDNIMIFMMIGLYIVDIYHWYFCTNPALI